MRVREFSEGFSGLIILKGEISIKTMCDFILYFLVLSKSFSDPHDTWNVNILDNHTFAHSQRLPQVTEIL